MAKKTTTKAPSSAETAEQTAAPADERRTSETQESAATTGTDETAAREDERRVKEAEEATAKAEAEGRLPETMAITNPGPAAEMDSASGAFVEEEIKAAIPVEHPAVDNNPRRGTSAVQNGADFNDPRGGNPSDPGFAGQGLDLSVYGKS